MQRAALFNILQGPYIHWPGPYSIHGPEPYIQWPRAYIPRLLKPDVAHYVVAFQCQKALTVKKSSLSHSMCSMFSRYFYGIQVVFRKRQFMLHHELLLDFSNDPFIRHFFIRISESPRYFVFFD